MKGKVIRRRRPTQPHGSWQDKFIEELRTHGMVRRACREVHISYQTAYDARKKAIAARPADAQGADDFAARWEDAIEEVIERMEGEAFHRGVEGYAEPVYYRGEEVGEITRYSDGLLSLLLKANRPKKYRENIDVTVTEVPPETRALLEKYYASIGVKTEG